MSDVTITIDEITEGVTAIIQENGGVLTTIQEGAGVTVEIGNQIGRTGPQGPVGPQGAAGVSAPYVHIQSSPSSIWIINHNLGRMVSASIFDSGGVEIAAQCQNTSINQAVIYFNIPIVGTAYFI
jgi:hypothetical protein